VYLHPPAKGSTLRWALQPPPPHELLKKTLKAFRAESLALARRGFREDHLDDVTGWMRCHGVSWGSCGWPQAVT
jgi:hypothetical protein